MLRIAALSLAMIFPLAARAQTYVAKLESGPLSPLTGGGVPGVTHLTIKLESSQPFQSGVEGAWTGEYDFSDGYDTRASLTAQGFVPTGGAPTFEIIYDPSGKVTGWFFHILMAKPGTHKTYEITGEYNIDGSGHAGTCGVDARFHRTDQSSIGDGRRGRLKP
jgi:hypothetical protein